MLNYYNFFACHTQPWKKFPHYSSILAFVVVVVVVDVVVASGDDTANA